MGTLKTTNIQTISGSGTLTLGTSGETLALGSGVTSNLMYPAFQITLSSNQIISDNTTSKVQFDTEDFDTDSAFDTTTNYRFTVPSGKAGKYFLLSTSEMFDNNDSVSSRLVIYKNGAATVIGPTPNVGTGGSESRTLIFVSSILDLAVSDYIEIYAYHDSDDGNPGQLIGAGTKRTMFYGYRIGS